MIVEYYRPKTIDEALAYLQRTEPPARPLGGGTVLNRRSLDPLAAVDLQALGLDTIQERGNSLDLGATLTLQKLVEAAGPEAEHGSGPLPLPPALVNAIRHEAAYNERQVGTIAGGLVSAGGRSPFATAMLALDAQLTLQPGGEVISLGDLLPLRGERLDRRLVTRVSIPLNVRLAYEYVARTPADQPIVCAAVAVWPSGRVRVALGGFGPAPTLAFDGSETAGAAEAAENAYAAAGDAWASAEYRRSVAGVLVRRALGSL